MKQVKRAGVVLVVLLAMGLFVLFFHPAPETSFKLPDGSTLALVGVCHGTNAFIRGSVLERLLGDWIRPQGISVFGRRIARPRKYPSDFPPHKQVPITLWFELRNRPGSWRDFDGELAKWKVFTRSVDGRRQFGVHAGRPRVAFKNVVFWSMSIEAFPRTDKEFRLRVEPWIPKGQFSPPVEFRVANPAPITARSWRGHPAPQTNQVEELAVILSRAQSESPIASGAWLDFQLLGPAGRPLEWALAGGVIEDVEGNRRNAEAIGLGENPHFHTRHGLEADKPWKVILTLTRTTNFHMNEIHSLNFGSNDIVSVTNNSGQIFYSLFDGHTLTVASPDWVMAPHRPLLELRATDAEGRPVLLGGPEWNVMPGRPCYMIWSTRSPVRGMRLQLVTPKTIQTEFLVIPEANEHSAAGESGR